MPNDVIREQEKYETSLTDVARNVFYAKGFCIPCGKNVPFRVDLQSGGRLENGRVIPNWRERLTCPSCGLSNRQRLIAALVMQYLISRDAVRDIYLMEKTTPLYHWIAGNFANRSIIGSEYFGDEFQSGTTIGPMDYQAPLRFGNFLRTARHKFSLLYSMYRMGGIRHENITALSFPDCSLDLIVSNDVFEHVPEPKTAFSECVRVLRVGGQMIATIPFHSDRNESTVRAVVEGKKIRHIVQESYHGNPISADGSLVFTDFGWNIIPALLSAGFADAVIEVYGAVEFGHLGGGQVIFRMTK